LPDDPTPTVEKVVETKETTKASTEVSAAAVISPTPPVIADDSIRKVLALGLVIQFTFYVLFVTYLLIYDVRTNLSTTASNLLMIILTAEIALMTLTYNYYFGSSSGSTAKNSKP